MKTQVVLPSWVFEVAKGSHMNLRDLAAIYKVNKKTIDSWVRQGYHPKADYKTVSMRSNTPIRQWRISTIIKFAKEQHDH